MVRVGAIDAETFADGHLLELVREKLPKEPVLFPKMRRYLSNAPDSFPDPEKDSRYMLAWYM